MNTTSNKCWSGTLALLMAGSLALTVPPQSLLAQETQPNTSDTQTSNTDQEKPEPQENSGQGAENQATPAKPAATPAQPSKKANPKASQTPSRTQKKNKPNKRSKRILGVKLPKGKILRKLNPLKNDGSTTATNAGNTANTAMATKRNLTQDPIDAELQAQSNNRTTAAGRMGAANEAGTPTKATATKDAAGANRDGTSDQISAGSKNGSVNGSGANQGNMPRQDGNRTENNQNNSQKNINTNVIGAQALMGLINVNVSNVNLNVYKVIDIHNVLNNSQVEVLTQKIQNSPGAQAKQEVLNNLLRDANVLKDNQVVVGVLSSMKRILTMNRPTGAESGGTTGAAKK